MMQPSDGTSARPRMSSRLLRVRFDAGDEFVSYADSRCIQGVKQVRLDSIWFCVTGGGAVVEGAGDFAAEGYEMDGDWAVGG